MTRIKAIVEFRFLRIPTVWEFDGKQFTPKINQGAIVPSVSTLDGWAVRNRFLRLKDGEGDILEFLSDVGVWTAVADPGAYDTDWHSEPRNRVLYGAFGSRHFSGFALPIDLAQFKIQRRYWVQLLGDESKMKARFGKPPTVPRGIDRLQFASDSRFYNEVPVRFEWKGGFPTAVAEAITGWEALVLTTHADLLRRAKWRVCKRPDCANRFAVTSGHRRKYCEWQCGHIESVRKQRREEKKHGKKR